MSDPSADAPSATTSWSQYVVDWYTYISGTGQDVSQPTATATASDALAPNAVGAITSNNNNNNSSNTDDLKAASDQFAIITTQSLLDAVTRLRPHAESHHPYHYHQPVQTCAHAQLVEEIKAFKGLKKSAPRPVRVRSARPGDDWLQHMRSRLKPIYAATHSP
jgi:hypothetical protein